MRWIGRRLTYANVLSGVAIDPGDDDSGDVDDAGRYGAIVTIGAKDGAGGGPVIANGTWAVTAP